MNKQSKKSHGKIIAIIIVLLLLIGAAVGTTLFLRSESGQTPDSTSSGQAGSSTSTPDNISTSDPVPDTTPGDDTPGSDTSDTPVPPDAPHEHVYEETVTNPTCTEKGFTTHTCSCGDSYIDTYVDANGHSWDNGVVEKEATKTEEGIRKYTCATCQETKTEVIPNANHVHEYTATVTNPTCTEKGYTTHTCRCGDSYVDSEVNATGHSYGSWKVTTAATCGEAGVETRTCSTCSNSETRSIAALSHIYGSWKVTKAAGCVTTGTETRTCSKCSYTETRSIEPTGHSYGSWSTTKQATCEADGAQSRTCSKCSKVETKVITKTGHKWDSGKMTVVPATCSDVGIKTYTCTTCSKTKTERVSGTHSYGEWQWEEYTFETIIGYNPTHGAPYYSTAKGHNKVRYCTACGHKETVTTEQHKHLVYSAPNKKWSYCLTSNITQTLIKEATCTEYGVYLYECSICDWHDNGPTNRMAEHEMNEYRRIETSTTDHCYGIRVWYSTCKNCDYVDAGVADRDGDNLIISKKHYSCVPLGVDISSSISEDAALFLLDHPDRYWKYENYVFDSEGYLIQVTVHAHHPETGECIKCVFDIDSVYSMVMNSGYNDDVKQKFLERKMAAYIVFRFRVDANGKNVLVPYIQKMMSAG